MVRFFLPELFRGVFFVFFGFQILQRNYLPMKRRTFIKSSALAGSVLSSFLTGACQSGSNTPGSGNTNTLSGKKFELDGVSIEQLQQGMRDGVYTSRRLVELYLKRIEEIDKNGVKLNSIIELNPDALALADASDIARNGRAVSPLHGIPFLVKDNIDTADRMMTTAGSLALSGHYARTDASIVTQLRQAGAVLLGKTNLSEWANFRSSRSSSGWSSRGGQTKNPYSLDRNPCGSSSGSAVAVAASLCAFSIGTETNGSITCPASINAIVGLKPTVGLLSRRGIIPISKTQDTAGPMTRTVTEAAIVLGALTATDDQDPITLARPQSPPSDYTEFLDADALQGKRIGVEKSFLKVHEKVDALLRNALEQMKNKGAIIVEVDHKERLKAIQDNEFKLLQYEFKDGLNRYLEGKEIPVHSLQEIIAWNREHESETMPYFGQEILEASQERGGLDEEEYKSALHAVVTVSRHSIDSVLQENKLDVLCGPATGPAWCTDLVNGDAFSGYGMGSGAAMAGYPSITVPLGEVHGLPVGLLFIGPAFAEPVLLGLAYAFEQASRNRRAPAFRERT